MHYLALLEAIDEGAGHLDPSAGWRHPEELAGMTAGDPAEQADAVVVDEQIFGREHEVWKRRKPDAVNPLDLDDPFEDAAVGLTTTPSVAWSAVRVEASRASHAASRRLNKAKISSRVMFSFPRFQTAWPGD